MKIGLARLANFEDLLFLAALAVIFGKVQDGFATGCLICREFDIVVVLILFLCEEFIACPGAVCDVGESC